MSKRYYVVQTQSRQEQIANQNLRNQRYTTFLPTLIIERPTTAVQEPLFPGYLFVELDLKADRWRSINGTRGVVRLLGEVETPAPVPIGFVEELAEQCAAGQFDRRKKQDQPLRCGDKAKLGEGSFFGMIGELIETRAQRGKVLLNFLGGAVKVNVMLSSLTAVASPELPA